MDLINGVEMSIDDGKLQTLLIISGMFLIYLLHQRLNATEMLSTDGGRERLSSSIQP
jgi:hypothetical protein